MQSFSHDAPKHAHVYEEERDVLQVVNWETKAVCMPHQIGQLVVMGPQTMPCYYKNPKATQEIIDAQGFVKTG